MKKFIHPLMIIFLAAVLRLVPHIPNVAPVTAMALFGGAYLNKRSALVIPLLTMMVSDYLLLYVNPFAVQPFYFTHLYPPQTLWYGGTMIAVYGSFLISGLIGLWLRSHKSVPNIILASLVASLQFFLITNAAVWLNGMYDRSLVGLWESYMAGIPFFRGTMLGDLFYTSVFFGGFALIKKMVSAQKIIIAR